MILSQFILNAESAEDLDIRLDLLFQSLKNAKVDKYDREHGAKK